MDQPRHSTVQPSLCCSVRVYEYDVIVLAGANLKQKMDVLSYLDSSPLKQADFTYKERDSKVHSSTTYQGFVY